MFTSLISIALNISPNVKHKVSVISDAYKIELKVLTLTEPTSDAHIKP